MSKSHLVAHQLMWNLETNMYTDEEGEERDPVMYDKLLPVRKNIDDVFTPKAKAFYERAVLKANNAKVTFFI